MTQQPYFGFLVMLSAGLLMEIGLFYGIHKLFPKVPGEVWFFTGLFLFMGWFFLCTISGMV